ncbi:MAG: cytochrome c oxidase subunit III [Rhodospirillaceae bacterium]|nr:MAG: cytochrome c oxidase subunit III [Rhodospirillaceae bacterium]
MTVQFATVHAPATQVHHWEVSVAPMALVFGVFFLLPLGFSAYFVYESLLLTAVLAGIGVPLVLFGVSKWVAEGLVYRPLKEGLASSAGLPIFIVSEICIFLSLFATYWTLRLGADVWPPAGTPEMPVVLPLLMTVLLVSSSVTIHIAEHKLDHKDMGGFRTWLLYTLVLGGAFLGCTIYEYSHLVHGNFVPGTNAFSTAFFSITDFHASHVLIGLLAFVAVLVPALGGRTNTYFAQATSIYWHFVDIVWFFVVSQIYFW